ncbi:MAG: MMPL family transporter [Candidatus Margulisiibacteriota bacterium]
MLIKLGEFIKKYYKWVLVGCALFSVLSIFWITRLELNTQLTDMFPENEPSMKTYEYALKNFGGLDSIAVVIEGHEKDIVNYIENIHPLLAKVNNVDNVIYQSETDFMKKHGLLLLKDTELDSLKGVLSASSIKDFLAGLNDNFEKEYIAGEDSNKLSKDRQQMLYAFNAIEDFLKLLQTNNPDTEVITEVSNKFLIGPKYLISPDRTLGLIFVNTPLDIADMDNLVPLINDLERVAKENQDEYNVKAGLAGFLVVQRDEMVTTERDMNRSSILALILILIIFFLGFRLLRYSVLAVIPLIVGITWALGLTYVFIGSLNLFTALMGAILIGLGIDYGIHIIAIYTEERDKGTSVEESITQVFRKAVKGIITGSITTAIGFGMFVLSSFPAFREFGLVLGTGILCTLVASVLILPSLLLIFGRKPLTLIKTRLPFWNIYEKAVIEKPWIVVCLFILLTVLSVVKFNTIEFTKSLKDIEAKGLESLALNDKLIEKFDFSNDATIAISKTLDEVHRLKDKAEDLDSVGAVESIANYIPLPSVQQERLDALRRLKKKISPRIDRNLYLHELEKELYRLEDNIIEISDLAYIGGEKKLVDKCDRLTESQLIPFIANNLVNYTDNLIEVQGVFIKNLKNIVLNSNSSHPVEIKDLPPNTKAAYVGKDGSFLTTIYPEADVWSNEFQPIYQKDMESLNIPLTGTSMMSIKVMEIAGSEGKRILLIVVGVIFLVLLLDFLSLRYAILAMVPMGLTLVLILGVMGWLKIKFDYVNVIALPIIIGIGVDDGVHLIHRYRIEGKLLPAIKSTGRGILLSTLTTIAAFGTLMVGKYQGFRSFGLLLILGIGWAYILTILLLSGLITLMDRGKK